MARPAFSSVGLTIASLLVAACSAGPIQTPAGTGIPLPTSQGSPPALDASRLRVPTAGWKTNFSKTSIDLSEIAGGGPPKDGIPAIDAPKYQSVRDARVWLSDRSPVISLAVGDQARAFPLGILIWHEIVNDTLAGEPVVVTFCPLCNTALVFQRELDRMTYDFGTTGNLRFSDLVMYDRQTESWWQQATGEAIVGELTGKRLTFLPAQIVSLAAFEAAHPGGSVLSRDTGYARDYGRNPYVGYDTVDQSPFLFNGVVDGRLPPMERVVTVGQGNEAIAFPYSELQKSGVASATVGGQEVVVFWEPGTASALQGTNIDTSRDIGGTGVYRPRAGGRQLTFARIGAEDGPIRDRETGSRWSVTGIAITGELEGSRLESVVHGDHFWFAWAAFSPQTTIWSAR